MLIPLLEGGRTMPIVMQASYWGSILPAVWSFMLALRERGLGTAWTTLHLMGDGEKQAAELLGIPFEDYTQAGSSRSPIRRAPISNLPSGCLPSS